MGISFDRYVRITSGVGGGGAVRRRDLIARFFTNSAVVPAGGFSEYGNADDVAAAFGNNSPEHRRALFYFGFVSKNTTRPNLISYGRWSPTAAAPTILGGMHATLAALQAITDGDFMLTIGAETVNISNLSLSSATSLSDVAAAVQTIIRTGTGTDFTQATVTYNATSRRFEFTGGQTGAATISVTPGTTTDVAGPLGWITGAIISNGVDAQTVTEALAASAQASNNFGSFAFVMVLTTEQITQAATWNSTQNVLYQFHTLVNPTNASEVSAAVINLAGVGLTLNLPNLTLEFPEVLPMAVLAATNYTRRAAVQNYMFQVHNLSASVLTNADANLYDGLRVNFYGQTQTAGQIRRFYQRGVLGGTQTAPVNMNTYANEQWLKDDAGARIMSLLLALPRVSANERGRTQVLSVVQSTINQALLNGAISVGRTLSDVQRIFITEQSGDERAFHQVQTSGYWVNASIMSSQTTDNRTEFRVDYTLIYAQDEVVRMVQGTHTLI